MKMEERKRKNKNLLNRQNFSMSIVIHFVLREKWPKVRIYMDTWAVENDLVG